MQPLKTSSGINAIQDHFQISSYALKACKDNGLTTINLLLTHFETDKYFLKLKNCPFIRKKELSSICRKLHYRGVLPDGIVSQVYDNIENELSSLLSPRAKNVCAANNLHSAQDILQYYSKYKTFKSFRNCGDRTELELLNFCKSHEPELPVVQLPEHLLSESAYEALSPVKKSIINWHTKLLISMLSVRSQNAIRHEFKVHMESDSIVTKIPTSSEVLLSIKNIGEKSLTELKDFLAKANAFLQEILPIEEDNVLSLQYIKVIVKTTFKKIPADFDETFKTFFDSNHKLKLFMLLDYLIEYKIIFIDAEYKIAKKIYDFDSKEFDRQELATELGLSPERVRQIKVKIGEDFDSTFSFVKSIRVHDVRKYAVDDNLACITINDDFCQKINQEEEVRFNSLFISKILGLLHSSTRKFIDIYEFMPIKEKNKLTRKAYFLIQLEAHPVFKFHDFFIEFAQRLLDKTTEPYNLHFEGYIHPYFVDRQRQLMEITNEILETMLFSEFETLIQDGYIHFNSEKAKLTVDYLVEALTALNEVSKVADILAYIENKHPGLEISESRVRFLLGRQKDTFFFIGRSSTYGLKIWEQERSFVKGGTIRALIEEYLTAEEEPKHISEITEYVTKYRDTTKYNIRQNIDLDESGRFRLFTGEFFGLTRKNYPNLKEYTKIKPSHFSIAHLKNFSGWRYDDIIAYFSRRYDYMPVQIRSILDKKIKDKDFEITPNNIFVYAQKQNDKGKL